MIDSRPMSVIFKLMISVTAMVGVVLTMAGADSAAMMLSYYTVQSNIIVALFFLALVFRDYSGGAVQSRDYFIAKGAVTMCIMLTFLVYNLMLRPTLGGGDTDAGNLLVHVLVPLMVFADYLAFDIKGGFSFRFIPFWCLIPLLYPIYVAIYGACGGTFPGLGTDAPSKYPYFFMNVDELGIFRVLMWMLILVVCFVGISALLVLLDRLLARIVRKRDSAAYEEIRK